MKTLERQLEEKLDFAQSALVALLGAISIRGQSLSEIGSSLSFEEGAVWVQEETLFQQIAEAEQDLAVTPSFQVLETDLSDSLGADMIIFEQPAHTVASAPGVRQEESRIELFDQSAELGFYSTEVIQTTESQPEINLDEIPFEIPPAEGVVLNFGSAKEFSPEELDFSLLYPFEGLLEPQLV